MKTKKSKKVSEPRRVSGSANPRSILSLDIGSSRIKMVEGNFGKDGLFIERIGQMPLPEYSIEKEQIKNAEILASEINNYLIQKNFRSKEMVVTIDAVGSVIREVDLPKASPKELTMMIKNEMINTYHIDETDIIQYKQIENYQNDSGAQFCKYRVAALDAGFVDQYHELVKLLKMRPISMDINMNAMDKLMLGCGAINGIPLSDKSVMMIDFGAQNTTAYIYTLGHQQIFRHLTIGSSEIEILISDMTLTAADNIRKAKEGGYDFFSEDSENEQSRIILKPYFYNLSEELRNIIRFYTNRFESATVDHIFLTGGGSKLKGLPEYLQNAINTPVQLVNSMSNINEKIPKRSLSTHLNAFGSLIRL